MTAQKVTKVESPPVTARWGKASPLCILCIAFMLILVCSGYSQTFDWVKQLGSDKWDEAVSITTDTHGNVYCIGNFDDTLDMDPGPPVFHLIPSGNKNVYISKLDASGSFVWAKQIEGNWVQTDWFNKAIAVDHNGYVHITGWFLGPADFDPGPGTFNLMSSSSSDAFICKLDPSGNFVWAIKFGEGPSAQIFPYPVRSNAIATDNNGNVFTTGSFDGKTDFDPGPDTFYLSPRVRSDAYTTDVFICKLNASGNFVWAKQLGGTGFEGGQSLVLDGNGNIYSAGFFNGTVDFDPGAATYDLSTNGPFETLTYISKLDPSGNFVWAKKLGGQQAQGLAVDNTGNTYVGCSGYYNWNGIIIHKLNSAGNNIWAKELMVYACTALAIDNLHNVYTTGQFNGIKDFDPGPGSFFLGGSGLDNSYISKLDSAGKFIWAKELSGTGLCQTSITALALDRNKNIFTTGYFNLTADFDPDTAELYLTAKGSYDAFIHKMKQQSSGAAIPGNDGAIKIYPNPTSGKFIIEFNNGFKCTYIVIRNVLGQLLQKRSTNGDSQIEMQITTAAGVYIVELHDETGERVSIRILKI